MAKKLKRIERKFTEEERKKHAKIRAAAMIDFPPKVLPRREPPTGLAALIQEARQAQGLTWYALAQKAGIPNQATIREIERGADVKLSNVQAVARALGLSLTLVPA